MHLCISVESVVISPFLSIPMFSLLAILVRCYSSYIIRELSLCLIDSVYFCLVSELVLSVLILIISGYHLDCA